MNAELLQALSAAFGNELGKTLDDSDKDAQLAGGGLRHGEVEWQIRYEWNGLERFLFFSIDNPVDRLVSIAVRGAATDAFGRWAYVPIASTTVPEELVKEQLPSVVRGMVEHGRILVNAIEHERLAPLVHEYFADGR